MKEGIMKTISKRKQDKKIAFKSQKLNSKLKETSRIKFQKTNKTKKNRAFNIPKHFYVELFKFITENSPSEKVEYKKMKTRLNKMFNRVPMKSLFKRISHNQQLLIWDLIPFFKRGEIHTSGDKFEVRVPYKMDISEISKFLEEKIHLELPYEEEITQEMVYADNRNINDLPQARVMTELFSQIKSFEQELEKQLNNFKKMTVMDSDNFDYVESNGY